MGVKAYTRYQVVPMPTRQDADGIGERVDLTAVEALLNAAKDDGWLMGQSLDWYAPAMLFSRRVALPDDEQVELTLERLRDLNIWAPESGIDDEDLEAAMTRIDDSDLRLVIRAVLAAM